ncbi:MAG: hypothetical protein Q4C18_03830 [Eubacteriales bacterium]|nr:hypothetical protein [Eubacteriales bacterium]
MGKGKQRPPQFNRQSKGYQQNMYKNQMKQKGVEMPKPLNAERMTKFNRVAGIVWVVAVILSAFLVGWKVSLAIAVLGLVYLGGFMLYMNNYLKKYIGAYKKMGVPKEMYLKQLRRNGTDEKQIQRMATMWDKAKED